MRYLWSWPKAAALACPSRKRHPLGASDFLDFASAATILRMQAETGGPESKTHLGGRSRAGAIISCVSMAACAGLLVLAMRQLPRQQTGGGPTEAASKVPDQMLRFIACDVRGRHLQDEPVLAEIKRLNPDYLILQNLEEPDSRALANVLQMHAAFGAGLAQSASPPIAQYGNCVLSKQMLSPPQPAAGIGIWTMSQVGNKSFLIGSIIASSAGSQWAGNELLADWQKRGSPPIVVAGRFPIRFADNNPVQLHSGWFDGLSAWERLLPRPSSGEQPTQIFLSPGWSCRAGGAISGYDLIPCWVDAGSSASATAPTTQAATRPAD